MRFFSPPEKPTLSARFSMSSPIFSALAFSRTSFSTLIASSSVSPRARRCAFSAVFRNVIVVTPGISTGYCRARNMPFAARSSGASRVRSSPR